MRSVTKTPSFSIFSRKLGVLGLSENRGKGEEQAMSLKAVEKADGLEVMRKILCEMVFEVSLTQRLGNTPSYHDCVLDSSTEEMALD